MVFLSFPPTEHRKQAGMLDPGWGFCPLVTVDAWDQLFSGLGLSWPLGKAVEWHPGLHQLHARSSPNMTSRGVLKGWGNTHTPSPTNVTSCPKQTPCTLLMKEGQRQGSVTLKAARQVGPQLGAPFNALRGPRSCHPAWSEGAFGGDQHYYAGVETGSFRLERPMAQMGT